MAGTLGSVATRFLHRNTQRHDFAGLYHRHGGGQVVYEQFDLAGHQVIHRGCYAAVGMCVMLTLPELLNSSPARWLVLPMPALP